MGDHCDTLSDPGKVGLVHNIGLTTKVCCDSRHMSGDGSRSASANCDFTHFNKPDAGSMVIAPSFGSPTSAAAPSPSGGFFFARCMIGNRSAQEDVRHQGRRT